MPALENYHTDRPENICKLIDSQRYSSTSSISAIPPAIRNLENETPHFSVQQFKLHFVSIFRIQSNMIIKTIPFFVQFPRIWSSDYLHLFKKKMKPFLIDLRIFNFAIDISGLFPKVYQVCMWLNTVNLVAALNDLDSMALYSRVPYWNWCFSVDLVFVNAYMWT